MISNRERFIKRRQRILGPNGSTLKALELLTSTYILVQGNTVAVMGPYKGLKEVRRVVEDCLANIHPIYHIKELMIKRELAKDETLKDENWERFLPGFKRKTLSKRRKPRNINKKGGENGYTPFPPEREKSKIDLQIESGEFFLGKQARERAEKERRIEGQREKAEERRKERDKAFVPPKEETEAAAAKTRKKGKEKRKRDEELDQETESNGVVNGETEAQRKERKRRKRERRERKAAEAEAGEP